MVAAAAIVSVLLAALLVWSAIRKLSHREHVVQSYLRVGVPRDKLNHLAAVLLAGAAGLLLGLWWAPLGVAAAAGVVCYFAVALGCHARAHDMRNALPPLTLLLLAVVALVLRLMTW